MRRRAARILTGLAAVAVLATAMLAALPAQAQQQVVTRAWAHPGYGRIVFDFGVPVGHSAAIDGDRLVVAFDRPVTSSFARVLRNLGDYVTGAELADSGRQAVFALRRSYTQRSFTDGTAVVVDLLPGGAASAPASAAPVAAGSALPVRTGEHAGFSRMVFDWTRNVGYQVSRDGDLAIVSFDTPAQVDGAALRRRPPRNLRSISAVATDTGLTVNLGLPQGARLRHFRSGTRVVVDVLGNEGPAPATRTAASAPASATPAPQAPPAASEPPAPPAAPASAVAANRPAAAPIPLVPQRASAGTDGEAASDPEPAETASAPAAQADTRRRRPPREVVKRVAVEGELNVAVKKDGPTVSLQFPWPGSVGAAGFRRAGFLWLVFDEEARLHLDGLESEAPEVFQFVQQLPIKGGVAIRMVTPSAINPVFRRDGHTWIVDLRRGDMEPTRQLDSTSGLNRSTGSILVFQATSPGQTLSVEDPEVGDTLAVTPLFTPGEGVRMERRYPEFRVLASAQGVAIEPRADGVGIRTSRSGVVISRQGGLFITPNVQNLVREKQLGEPNVLSRLLNVKDWERGGLETYGPNRQALLGRIAKASPERRGQGRLDLARFYFANGFAAEALAVMRVIEQDTPPLADNPSFRLMRAASNVLMGRNEKAMEDLRHPSLNGEVEADLWIGAVAAELGDWGGASQRFRRSVALLPGYSERIKQRVGTLAAEAALKTRSIRRAERILRVLLAERARGEATVKDRGLALYLKGRLLEARGDSDGALAAWREVDETGDRLARAKASLARVEVFARSERMTDDEVIQAYEDLRFAWRGGTIEFQLLQRLGDLYLDKADYRNGLLTLKTAATYFPDHPDAPLVTLAMSNAFRELFLQGGADALPPVTAIALYDEFRELAPAGPEGDEMIRRLADRLVSVDLLDRAATLLEHQVEFRLSGEQKARIGARLAVVRLLSREPEKALAALAASEITEIPETLSEQRRHLRARSLIEQEKFDEAAIDLAGDDTEDGLRLLAEAQWRQQQWNPVGETLARLAEKTIDDSDGLNLGEVRTVVSLAVALAMSDNDRALRELRRQYGEEMARSGFREAFDLLSRDVGIGLADFARLNERIQLAESFQGFMQTYRQRAQEGRLSAIN